MSTGTYPRPRVYERNDAPDGVSRSFSTVEQQRGQTLQRINALKASLSSIVSSHMRRLDSQNGKRASKVFEKYHSDGEMIAEGAPSWPELNGDAASRNQPEDSRDLKPPTPTTLFPITSSEALFPLPHTTPGTGHKGSHLLLDAHRQIEALMREKHALEQTCLNYEEHMNELQRRGIEYGGDPAIAGPRAPLAEKGALTHSQEPPLSSPLGLTIQGEDARCRELLISREASDAVRPRTLPLSTIAPLLRLLNRLYTSHPELLKMGVGADTAGTSPRLPDDWTGEEWGIRGDEMEDRAPTHAAVVDLNEEEIFRMLKHLENILPWLVSASQTMGFLTSAGANLLDWVKALEDEVGVHRVKVVEIAEKLQMTTEVLKIQMLEKDANVKAAEKKEESLREVVDLIHVEFVKQQACIETQRDHIQELNDKLGQLTASKTSEAEEFMAARQRAVQEVGALTAQIEELKRVSESDRVVHASQIERLQCQLEETTSLLSNAVREGLDLTVELETLHRERLIAEDQTQYQSTLAQCLTEEKTIEAATAALPPSDEPTLVELQRLVDISAMVRAENEERRRIELREQRSANAFYDMPIAASQKELELAQEVARDAESDVGAVTRRRFGRPGEDRGDAAAPVCEGAGGRDRPLSAPPPAPTTPTWVGDPSPWQAEITSLEEKATSLEGLLDTIAGVSPRTEGEPDGCVPRAEEVADGPPALPQEFPRTQRALARLGRRIDSVHFRLTRGAGLAHARAGLPRISVPWRELEAGMRAEAADGDGPAARVGPPLPDSFWDLEEVAAALARGAEPVPGGPGDLLGWVGQSLAQALGLSRPGTPSFALWDRFLWGLRGVYRAQRGASPRYRAEAQAARAARLFGALVLRSGVLARAEMTFGEKWAAVVASLCQLLGCAADYGRVVNPQDESRRRWAFAKELIQRVENSIGHSQGQSEGPSMSFVPHGEDGDPITLVYHLLFSDSVEFRQGFMLSCCARLDDAEESGHLPLESFSTTSLLQLFLMLSQEVDFFDPSVAINYSLMECDRTRTGDDEGQTVMSLSGRLLSHIDGRVLPLLLLVSRVLSKPSPDGLVGALLAARGQLINQLFHKEEEAHLLPSVDHSAVSSVAMETFVNRILSKDAQNSKNVMSPSTVSSVVSDRELLQLYKDNLMYRKHLEALLSSIEGKEIRSHKNSSK